MKRFTLISFALIALIGCGGEEPTLTEAETQQALTAVTAAAATGASAAAFETNGQEGRLTVEVTANCTPSGTVRARGEVEVTATATSYALDLSFDGCSSNNIVVDGALSYTGSASDQGVSLSMSGELAFSGAVQGTCAIDLEQSLDAATSAFSLTGSACGNDVSISFQGN